MSRYKCANCGFIFDSMPNIIWGVRCINYWSSFPVVCPRCGSNACDPMGSWTTTITYSDNTTAGAPQEYGYQQHKDRRGG